MRNRFLLAVLAMLAAALLAEPVWAGCSVGRLVQLPVTMMDQRPVVTAKINGLDAQFVADSGMFFSLLTHANAEKYGLSLRPAPFGFSIAGATGLAGVEIGTAKNFTLDGIPFGRMEFFVGGSEVGADTVGLLGQNFFRIGDVEYDLANGVIRIFRTKDCGGAVLAYWAAPNQALSVISIESTTPAQPHTKGQVFVNGVRLTAIFDTGAATSVLTLRAAARAGVRPDSPGVIPAGRMAGIGQRTIQSWVAPIASFKIGDEEIKTTRMQISDIELTGSDMLLGADFFLAHRVYVASSQHKLYLTYNGGAVFNLGSKPTLQPRPATTISAASASPASTSSPQTTPAPTDPAAEVPTDAAGFNRRGDAYLSRRQLDEALADLTRAVELAPTEPDYVYDRARARLANRQSLLAMVDLDQALKLKPDHLRALVLRADLLIREKDKSQAIADLDAVDKLASKQDDVRLQLAGSYEIADRLKSAIAQYDLWISQHGDDYRLAQARNGRCWARALLGEDLDKALADCNAALKLSPHAPNILDSRGLVFLRLGELDKAIADYDETLKINPKVYWSLYGRGLAKLRKGMKAEGQADIAAATAIAPLLPENATRHGIVAPAP